MARKRMIDPSIWTDEGMAELTVRQQLMYIGLFSMADDDGRLKASAAALGLGLPTVFAGVKRADIDADRNAVVHQMTQLREYSVNGVAYLVFSNFRKWQVVNRPVESKLPPPPWITEESLSDTPPNAPDSVSDTPSMAPSGVSAHGGLTEDSRSPHGALTPNRKKEKGIEGNRSSLLPERESRAPAHEEPSGPEPFIPPNPPSSLRNLPRSPLPTDWQPDEITILTARNVGLSPEATMATLDKFRDHHQTKGTLNADWQAAARMWLKDQPRFQQPAMVGNGPPIPIRDNIIRHGDPPDENPF